MKRIAAILVLLGFGATVFANDSIEDRLSALEEKSILNNFEIRGDLSFYYASLELEDRQTPTNDNDRMAGHVLGHLNFAFDVSDHVKVYSSLGIRKMLNIINKSYQGDAIRDIWQADWAEYEDRVFWKRFYADVTLMNNLILSAGRLPTSSGPPTHIYDGLPRQGTYTVWGSNNLQLDGLALTYKFDDMLPQNQNLAFRIVHTPFQTSNGTDNLIPSVVDVDGDGSPSNQTIIPSGEDVYHFQLDYGVKNLGWVEETNWIAQHYVGNTTFNDRYQIAFTGNLGIKALAEFTSLYFDFIGIMNTGLDIAVMYSNSTLNSGTYVATDVFVEGEDVTGDAYITNLRYRFANSSHVGYEYVHFDKDSTAVNLEEENFIGFTGVQPGYGNHFYYSAPIKEGVTVRIGYMERVQTAIATATGGGTADATKTEAYTKLRVAF